ncbi:MAG: ABC transporter substrate-binding protein [Propylenella sp.]
MRRRALLLGVGGMLASPLAWPQASQGARRLIAPINAPEPRDAERVAMRQNWFDRLAALGWVHGKNLQFQTLYSGGDVPRLRSFISDALRSGVDAILVFSTSGAIEAARATTTVPIVLAGASAYPTECGLIKSYARPGTNVTGVAWFQGIEVNSKLVQFVADLVPAAKRLAWIVFPDDLVTVSGGEFSPKPYYAKVAYSAGFDFAYHECRAPDDLDRIFLALQEWRAHAVIIEPALFSFVAAARIAQLANQAGFPTFGGFTRSVVDGGLLGYSPIIRELHNEALPYVDRIFRGAKPSEMPVVMPNKLELSLNLKTARALGITIPPRVLLAADRIIQ